MAVSEPHEESNPSSVQWVDESMPYLQCTDIWIHLSDERVLHLLSRMEDGTGVHGFHVVDGEAPSVDPTVNDPGSIFRARDLPELPLGQLRLRDCRDDGLHAVIEATFDVDGRALRFLAAEIHEGPPGLFSIAEADETILLQVDGARPVWCVPGRGVADVP